MSIEPPGAPEVANPSTMGFCLAISAVAGDQQNASSGRKLHITSHVTSVKTPIKIRLPHDEISHNAPTQICHRCSGTSMVTDDNHHRYSVHRSYAQQWTTPKSPQNRPGQPVTSALQYISSSTRPHLTKQTDHLNQPQTPRIQDTHKLPPHYKTNFMGTNTTVQECERGDLASTVTPNCRRKHLTPILDEGGPTVLAQ